MLRIIRKTRRRMRVYVGGARKGSGWFKGKRGNVVRLYREDVGVFVSKERFVVVGEDVAEDGRWVNAGHKMKIKGRRRFIYGEISGRGRFNDLVVKLVRIGKREEDVVNVVEKARIKVRRKHVVLTRGRWRLRVRKVRRRKHIRFFARIFRAKGREDWEESQARRLLSEAKKVEVVAFTEDTSEEDVVVGDGEQELHVTEA